MITWLEDPTKYAYLRKTSSIHAARFPVKSWGRHLSEFGRLVGYRRHNPSLMPYAWEYDVYWLKKHDRDLAPADVYAGPSTFGGRMPTEAIDPRELVGGGSCATCGWADPRGAPTYCKEPTWYADLVKFTTNDDDELLHKIPGDIDAVYTPGVGYWCR